MTAKDKINMSSTNTKKKLNNNSMLVNCDFCSTVVDQNIVFIIKLYFKYVFFLICNKDVKLREVIN